jgi:hypothetical protein
MHEECEQCRTVAQAGSLGDLHAELQQVPDVLMRWALAAAVVASLAGIGVAVFSSARPKPQPIRVVPTAYRPRKTMPTIRIPRESMRTVVYERRV